MTIDDVKVWVINPGCRYYLESPRNGEKGRLIMRRRHGSAALDARSKMRVAVEQCKATGTPISRETLRAAGFTGSSNLMGELISELIEEGVIGKEHVHKNRACRADWDRPVSHNPELAEEQRVELPPLRDHAPEVPPPTEAEESAWDWLSRRYWTPSRRDWYRRAEA